jgi:isopropylmalate/homocitrate/citramalate synthase
VGAQRKYDLSLLRSLEKFVAVGADVQVPFNNYVTGACAFTHKAGVHSKAVMTNPTAYEVQRPVGKRLYYCLSNRMSIGLCALSLVFTLDCAFACVRARTSLRQCLCVPR